MMLGLIKKDFMLVRKYVLVVAAISLLFPFLIMQESAKLLGLPTFMVTVVVAILMLYQTLVVTEERNIGAQTLLACLPYPRRVIVYSRYAFCLITYAGTYLLYTILALAVPKLPFLSLFDTLMSLLVFTILIGFYTPVFYRFGFEKTRYFFMIVVFGFSFLVPVLSSLGFKLPSQDVSSNPLVLLGMAVVIIALFVGSMLISVRIFGKKEL